MSRPENPLLLVQREVNTDGHIAGPFPPLTPGVFRPRKRRVHVPRGHQREGLWEVQAGKTRSVWYVTLKSSALRYLYLLGVVGDEAIPGEMAPATAAHAARVPQVGPMIYLISAMMGLEIW